MKLTEPTIAVVSLDSTYLHLVRWRIVHFDCFRRMAHRTIIRL